MPKLSSFEWLIIIVGNRPRTPGTPASAEVASSILVKAGLIVILSISP